MRAVFLFVIVFFLPLAAVAQPAGFWDELSGPFGGTYRVVDASNGRLYATPRHLSFSDGDWRDYVFRSTDNGLTWEWLSPATPPGVAFDNFLIGHNGSFFINASPSSTTVGPPWRSTDDGNTWQLLPVPPNTAGSLRPVVETRSGAIIVHNSSQFFRTTDGGQTWTAFPSSAQSGYVQGSLAFVQTPSGRILGFPSDYATTGGGKVLYVSNDEGLTWQKKIYSQGIYARPFITLAGTILYRNLNANKIYRSTNSGTSFTELYSTLFSSGPVEDAFTQLPSGRILMVTAGRVLYSDDDGITWQIFNTPYRNNFNFLEQIPPLPDGTLFANRRGGLVRSVDNGLTWTFSGTGTRHVTVLDVQFATVSVGYAHTDQGLWKTSDGGQTWSVLVHSRDTLQANTTGHESFCLAGPDTVLFRHGQEYLLSTNGGQTFSNITPPVGSVNYANINHTFIDPVNHTLLVAGTDNKLLRSTNLGLTWQVVLPQPLWIGSSFAKIIRHPSGTLFGVARHDATWMLSANGGQTWQTGSLPDGPDLNVADMVLASDGSLYILAYNWNLGESVLLRSGDLGQNWETTVLPEINFDNNELKHLQIDYTGHIFIASYQNVFRSVNGGQTWQMLPEIPGWNYGFNIHCLRLAPDRHLYVGVEKCNRGGLLRSAAPVDQGAYLRGTVRLDSDNECATPGTQGGLVNWIVKATDGPLTYYTNTANDGRYEMFVDTGSYTVRAHVPQAFWWGLCDSTGQAVLPTPLLSADTVDFRALALADCPLMSVQVAVPRLRRCFDNLAFIQYCNQGTEPATDAYVDLTLDPYLTLVNSELPYQSLGNDQYRIFVGTVAAGQCDQFQVTVQVDCDSTVPGQTHCITAHGFPDTLCTPVPNWSGANLVATATCQDSIVQLHIENTGSAPSQPLDYIIIEDDVVMLQGTRTYQPGETFTMPQPANGSTWRIESEQEPGHPFSTLALAFTEGCGGFQSLGFINQFTVNGITPSWHTACLENIGAYDPNDKQGFPRGFDPENNIRPGQELEYRIRFQNTGTDTAFTVVLRDTLAPWLDPASVRVGASSHAYTWALEGTGVLVFTFANILLPDSNVNEPASHGFVSFSIDQEPDVPVGTEILNSAAIYFDFNAPVITNQTLHTVAEEYLTGPTSHTASTTRQSSSVLIHPNPAVDATVVRPRDGAFAGERFTLTNAFGQVVHTATLRGREYRLVRGTWPSGMYWFRVEGRNGQLVQAGSLLFR